MGEDKVLHLVILFYVIFLEEKVVSDPQGLALDHLLEKGK